MQGDYGMMQGDYGMMQGDYGMMKGGGPVQNFSFPAMPGPKSMKAGDWLCPACGNHNYASRVNCNRNKCGALRPGFKAGDWVCRDKECLNHNFANREVCNKCQKPKME